MGYIEGTSRDQAMILVLDEMVASESMVRVIDRFVEVFDLGEIGFANIAPSQNGRPSYRKRQTPS